MNEGKTVFTQLMDFVPKWEFRRCVARYGGQHKVKTFTCYDQFLSMAFAQLTWRESLRDIESSLRAGGAKLYHMGFRGKVSRNTLANANNRRDWRIYRDFAHVLIGHARLLYVDEPLGLELNNTIYALDATTIDLCLSLFPWATFRRTKGAVKLHTLLDLRGNIPCFIRITQGREHEVAILDDLPLEPGAFYIMDRGFVDFARLHRLHRAAAFFVIRAKTNLDARRVYSHAVDKTTGLQCDQTIALGGFYARQRYPDQLRRVRFRDPDSGQRLVLLTNNFALPPLVIAQLYKMRWQVELFFKWIKQHLRIKAFYGTSPNAVRTQIWIAITIYVLVAIVKKQLKIPISLYTILQVLSVIQFEKTPLLQALTTIDYENQDKHQNIQLNLFD